MPREVAILDECSALCMRKRKSLISKYRGFERTPRLLAFMATGLAMVAALLMFASTYTDLSPMITTLMAALVALVSGLFALSSVVFFSPAKLVDAVDGASAFLSLSNRCQIDREKGVVSNGVSAAELREIIAEFNSLSSRYDRLLPASVGNLTFPKASELPSVIAQKASVEWANANSNGGEDVQVAENVLDHIDQIIDDIKLADVDDDTLANFDRSRRKSTFSA